MTRPTSIRAPMTGALGILMALLVLTATALPRAALAAKSSDKTPALGLEIQDAIGPATAEGRAELRTDEARPSLP